MDLETALDEWYQQHGITEPEDIDMDQVCRLANVKVLEADCSTVALCERRIILVRSGLDEIERREHIAHELAHITLHCGGQIYAPVQFVQLQESQAESLARKILVPRFMLRRAARSISGSDAVAHLSWIFRVSPKLMLRRLEDLSSPVRNVAARAFKLFLSLFAMFDGLAVLDTVVDMIT